MHHLKRLTFLFVLILLVGGVTSAQRPDINVFIDWTPDEQLDTDGADQRFVDMQIYANANVEFWAVELSCSVGRGELAISPSADTVSFGNAWSEDSSPFFATPDYGTWDTSRNTYDITITRVGADTSPMSYNGNNSNILLLTLRFSVNPLDRDTTVRTICRTLSFVDRQGNRVTTARLARTNDLKLYTGFSISGTAYRAGSRDHREIRVTCEFQGPSANTYVDFTDPRGNFEIENLREQGLYDCVYASASDDIDNDIYLEHQFLQSRVGVQVNSTRHLNLPIQLAIGDYAPSGSPNNVIDGDDLAVVAGNFGNRTDPFAGGDANGSRIVDGSDLALVASNYDLTDAATGAIYERQMIFGLGRVNDDRAPFPNSKIWWGNTNANDYFAVDSRSRTRDFWPRLSPDGYSLALIAADTRNGYQLATRDMDRGFTRIYRFPRGFDYEAFAPSWSPDGDMLAFICSWFDEAGGYLYNEGYLCLLDPDDTRGDTLELIPNITELYPPAWLTYQTNNNGKIGESYVMLYVANNQLNYIDFGTGKRGIIVSSVTPGANNQISMPSIVNVFGTTQYLVYKFSDISGNTELRTGTIAYTPAGGFTGDFLTGISADTNDTHQTINGTSDVEYYDSAGALEVYMYTDQDHFFTHHMVVDTQPLLDGDPATWASNVIYTNHLGNPRSIYGQQGASRWDGDYGLPSMIHAERITFDMVLP